MEAQTQTLEEMPNYTGPKDMVVTDTSEFSNLLDTAKFNHLWRVAQVFAKSMMVPAHFQNDPASTLVALQMAFRLDVDPLMLLQKTYVIGGKPGIEAQLAIALINTRGPFTGPIQWRFEPNEDAPTKCTAYAKHKITGETCQMSITMDTVKAEGWLSKDRSKWKTIPAQMFRYRTAMWLGRAYCPEVLMGLYSVEELLDGGAGEPIDVTPEVVEPEPPAITFDEFLEKCGCNEKRDQFQVKRFIDDTAETHGMSLEALIAEASKTDENLAEFLSAFDAWAAKQEPEPEQPPEPPADAKKAEPEKREETTKPQGPALASADEMNGLHEMLDRKKVGDIYQMDVVSIVGKLQEMDGGDLTADTCKKVMAGLIKKPMVTSLIGKALKAS